MKVRDNGAAFGVVSEKVAHVFCRVARIFFHRSIKIFL